MKILLNILTSILSPFILLFLISSCNNEEISKAESETASPFSEIAALSSNSQFSNIILENYGVQNNNRVTNKFGNLNFDKAEIGYSNSSNSTATLVPFGDGLSSLVVLGDENGTIHEEFIATITPTSDNSSEVNYFNSEGTPTISFSVVDGKIENLVSHSTSGRLTWDSCATCAVTSCGADGGCTIMCGLLGPWCLAGIAISCIGSDLAC